MRPLHLTDVYSPESSLISIDRAISSIFSNPQSPLNCEGSLKFHVMPYEKNQVVLSVVVSEDMINHTSNLLESLFGMFKVTGMKGRHYKAQEKVHDLEEIQKREDYIQALTLRVVQTFDELRNSGLTINQAKSQTNKALKGSQFDLSAYQVEIVLRGAGKLRKKKTE